MLPGCKPVFRTSPGTPVAGIVLSPVQSLKGHFLIAAPSLNDSNFHQSVVLILQHDQNGALGVVINQLLEITIRDACEQVLEVQCEVSGFLHKGGPCENLLMILHTNDQLDPDDQSVIPGLHFSTDKETIEALVIHPSEQLKFIVGYSGWGAGQLEDEINTGSWLISPASVARVFGPHETLWNRLISEANLSQWVNPDQIPDDPSLN